MSRDYHAELLKAAKDALDYIERRYGRHEPPKGMYEDLTIARRLAAAIADVEATDAHDDDDESPVAAGRVASPARSPR